MEADIKPFRGMLLGLFFVSTGASLDVRLMLHEPWIVLALLGGLLAVKVGIIGAIAPSFGLTKYVSVPSMTAGALPGSCPAQLTQAGAGLGPGWHMRTTC